MDKKKAIYLDNAATTPVPKEKLSTYVELMSVYNTNPSAASRESKESFEQIEKTRSLLLNSLGLEDSHSLFFVPTATIANNVALKSAANNFNHIQVLGCDHPSLVEPSKKFFSSTDLLKVSKMPFFSKNCFTAFAYTQSFSGIEMAEEYWGHLEDYSLHMDLSQCFGKKDLNLKSQSSKIRSFVLSAHKMGGPLGVAALGVQKQLELEPLIFGGGQEQGVWSGSLNPAAIIFWGNILRDLTVQRRHFIEQVYPEIQKIFGSLLNKFPKNLNLPFKGFATSPYIYLFGIQGAPSDMVMRFLEEAGVVASTSTACSSKSKKGLEEFLYLNLPETYQKGLLRFSFSPWQDIKDIQRAGEIIEKTFARIFR